MSNNVQKIVDAAKLHKDPIHKTIMRTKRNEAWRGYEKKKLLEDTLKLGNGC